VCQNCSGLLREQPISHRIKSITSSTFTKDEVEALKNCGNKAQRELWLARYDPRCDPALPDGKREDLTRIFLRWVHLMKNEVCDETILQACIPTGIIAFV
jgi:Putative GTPase activating protein for Arf